MEVDEAQAEVKDGEVVVPGDFLGMESSFSRGSGVCVRGGKVYSTLVGSVSISTATSEATNKPAISVVNSRAPGLRNVPTIGSLVLCQVVNISERQAKVSVLSVRNSMVLPEPLHGVVRREDVRAMEKDTVEVFHSLRPRDFVRARVIAHGEGQSYVLSTAENELGVVAASCKCGGNMLPVSWCEMQCSRDGNREKRKVAKVVDAIPVLM